MESVPPQATPHSKMKKEKREQKPDLTPPTTADRKPYLGVDVLPAAFHAIRPTLEDPIELHLITHAEATELLSKYDSSILPLVNEF